MRFRIVPSGDVWVWKSRPREIGFIVTDGVRNIIPGEVVFSSISDAMNVLKIFCESRGNPARFQDGVVRYFHPEWFVKEKSPCQRTTR